MDKKAQNPFGHWLFWKDFIHRSFDIDAYRHPPTSTDIHTVKDGLIVNTYHIVDWASALRQLGAK